MIIIDRGGSIGVSGICVIVVVVWQLLVTFLMGNRLVTVRAHKWLSYRIVDAIFIGSGHSCGWLLSGPNGCANSVCITVTSTVVV